MKKTKSLIALLIVLCLFLAIIPFKVFANESYTFTFAVQSGTNHQIVVENEALIIDGGYVEARDANNQNIGKAKYEGGVYKIVVESGKETELNFGVKNDGTIIGQKDINESTLRDVSRKVAEGIKPQV